MIFDHIGFNLSNFAKSKDFYIQALKPLGISIIPEGVRYTQSNPTQRQLTR
jgi:hypothetical protein